MNKEIIDMPIHWPHQDEVLLHPHEKYTWHNIHMPNKYTHEFVRTPKTLKIYT